MLRKAFVVALAVFATIVSSGPVPRQAAVTGKSSLGPPIFGSGSGSGFGFFFRGTSLTGCSTLDVQIFQFALTLEHIENAFYTAALAKFTVNDFVAAGYPSWVYGRFAEIAGHERTHVKYLIQALGPNAVPVCTYNL